MIIFGVSISVVVILFVGIFVARRIDGDSANFLVAGRRLGVPLVAVSLTAAAVDANATVGNTDLTADFGFWSGASLALGLAICLTLVGLFLAGPLNSMKLFTLGDFFNLRYGRATEVISSIIMVISFTILLAGNLVACGYLLERFAHIPYAFGIIISVGLVLAYTIAGGLVSDAYTGAIQTAITVVASIGLLVWTAMTFGIVIPEGMGPFDFEQLTSAAHGAPINWATLVALGIGDVVAIDFMQRVFGARSPQVARRACFTAAIITAVVGTILATSAVIVRNVFRVRSVEGARRDPLLVWTRAAMIPIVIVGSFMAIRISQTGVLLTLAFDLMLACLAGPFIAGVFWMRPGRAAILTAAGVGLGVRVVFLALQPTFYGVENNILHVPNTLVTEAFDGWATLLAFAISMSVFVLMAWLRPRTAGELEYELQVVEALRLEQEKELATAPELAPTAGAGVTAN